MTSQQLWKSKSNIQGLLLHGIPENKHENTDELCIKAINEHLDSGINGRSINRIHYVRNPRNAGEKLRPKISIL